MGRLRKNRPVSRKPWRTWVRWVPKIPSWLTTPWSASTFSWTVHDVAEPGVGKDYFTYLPVGGGSVDLPVITAGNMGYKTGLLRGARLLVYYSPAVDSPASN